MCHQQWPDLKHFSEVFSEHSKEQLCVATQFKKCELITKGLHPEAYL